MRVINRAPLAANVAVNTGNAQIFPQSLNAAAAANLAVFGTGRFSGRQFFVRASGYATTDAATTTAVVTLYGAVGAVPAAPLVAGSWTIIKASTARVINATSAPWFLQATLTWDLVSKKLQGVTKHMINQLYDADAANTNALTAVDDTAEPALNFAIGITFAVNLSAGNVGSMTEFSLGL